MRLKLTLFLLLLNAALFATLYYLEKTRSTAALFATQNRLVLDPGWVGTLTSIELAGASLPANWRFERNPAGAWVVTAPWQWRANPFAIERLLNQLLFLRWETRFSRAELERAGQSLATYGLAEPRVLITLGTANASQRLAIGTGTEIGNRLYLLAPDGEDVMVVPRDLLDSLALDLDAFLDPKVLDIPPFEASALQIQTRAPATARVRLLRRNDNWSFESPIVTAASNSAVARLLDRLQAMEWRELMPAGDEAHGLDTPRLRLTIEGLNRREILLFGDAVAADDAAAGVYARREDFPVVCKLDPGVFELLRNAQDSLRERAFLHSLDADWNAVEIRMGDRQVSLQRLENGQWQALHTDASGALQTITADRGVVQNLITRLRSLEAVQFASDAPSESDLSRYGLSDPQRLVRIRTGGGKALRLRIGALAGDRENALLYADTDQTATVYQIRPLILTDLALAPLHYRDRVLRQLPAGAVIERLSLSRPDAAEPLLSANAAELTRAANPVLAALAAFIRRTVVARYVPTPYADPLRLDADHALPWSWRIEAAVRMPGAAADDPPESVVLQLTERLGATTQYGAVGASAPVFILPQDLIELLDPALQPERPPPPVP